MDNRRIKDVWPRGIHLDGNQLTRVGTIPEHQRTLAKGHAVGHLVLGVAHFMVDDDELLLSLVGAHFYPRIRILYITFLRQIHALIIEGLQRLISTEAYYTFQFCAPGSPLCLQTKSQITVNTDPRTQLVACI